MCFRAPIMPSRLLTFFGLLCLCQTDLVDGSDGSDEELLRLLAAKQGCGNEPPSYSLTVEEHRSNFDFREFDGDTFSGYTTYRLYVDMVNNDDFLTSVNGLKDEPLSIETTGTFYNNDHASALGSPGARASDINPDLFNFYSGLKFDSWVTIGVESLKDPNALGVYLTSSSESWEKAFISGTPTNKVETNTGAWFLAGFDPSYLNGLPDSNKRVLIMQLTTQGTITGTVNVLIYEHSDAVNSIVKTFTFDGVGKFSDTDSVTDEQLLQRLAADQGCTIP